MNRICRFAAILGILAVPAAAQLTRGFVSGTVSDSSGAVVPKVRITLTEKSTGLRHAGLTNDAGVYRFVALEPGVYDAAFEKEGFDTVHIDNLELTTAQEVVLNQTLPVAGTATTVSVEATPPGAQLARATATVERTIGEKTIESMPLTGIRDVANLALLSPGTAIVTSALIGSYSANGQRTGANTVTLDGLDNSDPQYGFLTFNSTPELAAEVQVRTNSFSAEYGRGLGAQVSIVTRGGTNRLRGEAWDYFGSNRLSAATLANKYAGLSDVRFTDHQAGGSLGGPIRANKTFFFVLGQYAPHREGISANGIATITIPTAAGYSALRSVPLAPGQAAQSRQAILDSISFLPEIHGQVRRYDQFRSVSINNVPIEVGVTRIGQSRPSWISKARGRIDHRLSDRDSFTYSFQEDLWRGPVAFAWPFSNNTFGNRFASSEDDRNQLHSLSHTRILSPAAVNEVRVSAVRHLDQVVARDETLPRTTVMSFFTLGPAGASPFVRPRSTYEAQDILTWNRSRHSLKFGAHFLFVDDTISGTQQSVWTFNNLQDFINNQANRLDLRTGDTVQRLLSVRQNYFVQDDFKLRPNLTLNVGVRYQRANTPEGLFGAATPEIAAAGVPGPVRPDRNDIAPRFGFAYSPRGGATVLRGGYGIGYGLVYEGEAGANLLSLSSNYPWNTILTLDRPPLINRYPVPPASLPPAPALNPLANFTNYPSDAKNPTTHFYSLSVQREVARNHILELGYLGSRSYHLYVVTEHNPAILTAEQAQKVIAARDPNAIPTRQQRSQYPQWGLRTFNESSGYGNYNAGYVKFDRRFVRGLLIGANYTWSAALGVGEADIRIQNKNNARSDYARATLDVPHRFVIHYVWETPGKRVYSGWRISGISQWQSGRPFSILTGVDSNGDGGSGSDRPDHNPAGKLTLDPVTGNWRSFSTPLNGAGIVVAPLGTNGVPLMNSMPDGGNLGRNTFRGPAFGRWDLSLSKTFSITDRARFEFRADANNLFNHRNFGPPVGTMNSVNFGRNTSTPPSRVMVLGARLRF